MTKVKVARKIDVKPGSMIGLDVQGKKLLLAQVEGKWYALDGICTHMGGHLWEGKLIGTMVKCPRHGSEYDLASGRVLQGPWLPFGKAHDLRTYPVSVEGEDIFIEL